MKVGTLLLRGTIGGFFAAHGAQKLFGVAGGHGLKGTGQYFESLGLKPGTAHAAAAGVAEAGGGLGLVLGYHTPLAASGVIGTMSTAIHRVHFKNGWNIQEGGFEYNAVLIAAVLSIVEQGPGFLSLDALRGKQRHGLLPMAFALGAGVGGSVAVNAISAYFGGDSPEDTDQSEPAPSGSTSSSSESSDDVADPGSFESAAEFQSVTVEEALVDAPVELLVVEPLSAQPADDDSIIEALAEEPPADGPAQPDS